MDLGIVQMTERVSVMLELLDSFGIHTEVRACISISAPSSPFTTFSFAEAEGGVDSCVSQVDRGKRVERRASDTRWSFMVRVRCDSQARYAEMIATGMAPSTEPFMSRTLWTACVWDYFRRIDQDYTDTFKCPICGTMATAPILTMDGTALSCAAMFAKPTVPGGAVGPIHERISPYPNRGSKTGLALEERCLINNVELRTAILSMSKTFSSDGTELKVRDSLVFVRVCV